jgi:S1-C subfamily serine protease
MNRLRNLPTFLAGIAVGSYSIHCNKIAQDKPNKFTFIADAADKVMHSVVNITLESTGNMFQKNKFISSGSGFFINEDGTVLTNAHVVEDSSENTTIWIKTSNGECIEGYVHSYDALADLAIVKPLTKGKYRKALLGKVLLFLFPLHYIF